MDSDGPALSWRDRKKKAPTAKGKYEITSVTIQMQAYPMPVKTEKRMYRESGEEIPPTLDMERISNFISSLASTNQAIDVSRIEVPKDDGKEKGDDKGDKGAKGKGAKGKEGKGKEGKGKVAPMSAADKIKFENSVQKELKNAEREINQLLHNPRPMDMKLSSATGKLAQNMMTVAYYWANSRRAEAIDIWLDIGFDGKALHALVESEDDYVKFGDGFLIPDALGDVYEKTRPQLVAVIKFLAAQGDLPLYQLTDMGDRLVPLNFKLFHAHSLDPWQIRTINALRAGTSVLVCAPTSSGKTLISTFVISDFSRDATVLMVVPSQALALQVGSMFHGVCDGNIWIASTQFELVPESRPRAIVGTPDEIETLLVTGLRHALNISHIVVDEIHNLNHSASTERLIHMLPKACLLGLSATVGNADHLHKWMQSLNPARTVLCEVVKERFFNLQLHTFDCDSSRLTAVSPLASLTPELLALSQGCDIPFVPQETVRLYDALKPHSAALAESLQPGKFFPPLMAADGTNRPSLGQVRQYGRALVQGLCSLPADAQQAVFAGFKIQPTTANVSLSKLVPHIMARHSSMLPMLAFSLDDTACRAEFMQLLDFLEESDDRKNAGRAERVRKERRQYEKQKRQWQATLDRINSEQQREEYLRENPAPVAPADEDELDHEFVVGVPKVGADIADDLWAMLDFSTNFKDRVRYRAIAHQYMEPYIRALRRGFALFTRQMPVFYLRLVQRLSQQGHLGLVISDESLAHGVNMPFRTVAFIGDHARLTPTLAQQMSGRAGRRGLDRSGNVVFMGVSEERIKELINGRLVDVVGTNIANLAVFACPCTTNTVDRGAALKSIFFNALQHFPETPRTAEAEAAHKAAVQATVAQYRAELDKVPLNEGDEPIRAADTNLQSLLYVLRDDPVALAVCIGIMPALVRGVPYNGSPAFMLDSFGAYGRWLETVAAGNPWPAPEDGNGTAVAAAVAAALAPCKALLPASASPDLADNTLWRIFLLNSVSQLALKPGVAAPAPLVGVSHSSSTVAVSTTPDEEAEAEDEDVDAALADLDIDEERAEAQFVSMATRTLAYDFATLYAHKDRVTRLQKILLAMRNYLARRVWNTRPWTLPKGSPLSPTECTEAMLRGVFRRLYWALMEVPF